MESSLSCKHCLKMCPNPDSLRNHSVRCTKNPACELLVCPDCGKEFYRKDNYHVHVSKKQCKNKNKHCPEANCSFTYYFRTALIPHMKSTHGKDFKDEETHTFLSHEEFLNWKHDIEKRTMSYYSLQTGEKKGKKGTYSYYFCQHDGPSRSHIKGKEGQKKRKPAFKGKIKKDIVCTSLIQVKKIDGLVHVTFHPTHSHAIDVADLKHQPLSVEISDYINNQIVQGISLSQIRDKIRDKFAKHKRNEESSYDRNDFIQMKALRERKRMLYKKIHEVHSMYLKTSPQQLSTRGSNSPTEIPFVKEEVPSSPEVTMSSFIKTPPSSDSEGEPTQCQKISNLAQFDKLNAELSMYVHSEKFPKDLLPYVKRVLSKLIAECVFACNNKIEPVTTVPNVQPTRKRTSTKKLVGQKKKQAKKTKYPTDRYSLDELNALVVEEEEELSAQQQELNALVALVKKEIEVPIS